MTIYWKQYCSENNIVHKVLLKHRYKKEQYQALESSMQCILTAPQSRPHVVERSAGSFHLVSIV